ncbi:MAG TPA: hypothetical protein VK510_14890 [Solirubrobacteraceae bacterium]|jgi:hypothetical protein|nr:hypothetical protein [Solirubrobacteraceae bacterium]
MPVAVVQDWIEEETDRSTTNYDAVSERLQALGAPPAGMLVHTAGFTGNGFRIFEVWESREDFERFLNDVLMPIVQDIAPSDDRQPQTTVYELHNFIATSQ